MRAVILEGPKTMVVREVPTPKSNGNKVLIKISKVGICGSDLHMWKAGELKGLIMGHEFCGTVVDPGCLQDTLKEGDRVTAFPMNPCGKCSACKVGMINMCESGMANIMGAGFPGAFAEYFLARPDMVRKLPDNIDDETATMIEPAAVALRAVYQAKIKPGDKVLITGGGIIGLLCANWARQAGASFIALTEVNQLRLNYAKKMGEADLVLDGRDENLIPKLMEASGGGFDVALECTGVTPGIDTSILTVKPSKRIVLVGVSFVPVAVSTFMVFLKELELKGTAAYTDEFDICMDLIAKGKIKVKKYISDTVSMDGVQDAFERLSSGKTEDVKILINTQI
jgi:L-iditol 2-dehydrogenase